MTIFACSKCFLICIFRKKNMFFSILDPENIDKFKKKSYLCVQEEILEKFKKILPLSFLFISCLFFYYLQLMKKKQTKQNFCLMNQSFWLTSQKLCRTSQGFCPVFFSGKFMLNMRDITCCKYEGCVFNDTSIVYVTSHRRCFFLCSVLKTLMK